MPPKDPIEIVIELLDECKPFLKEASEDSRTDSIYRKEVALHCIKELESARTLLEVVKDE